LLILINREDKISDDDLKLLEEIDLQQWGLDLVKTRGSFLTFKDDILKEAHCDAKTHRCDSQGRQKK
jgi:hypothetical protein